ncbi:hypothetical protein [Streptomyces sp. NPDC058847]|uniref:hypothetical protein n=1 Tax=Streptomyces sp. NPDC058847 TaxID=3346649 RepID=UPI0036A0F0CB
MTDQPTLEDVTRLEGALHLLRYSLDRFAQAGYRPAPEYLRDLLDRITDDPGEPCDRDSQYERAERAEAAIGRVRALHQPAQGLGYDSDEDDTPGSYGQIAQACTTCGTTDEYAVRWPCDTIRALDESSVPAATEVTEPEDEWTGPLVPPILTEAIRQHDAETERAVAALAQAYGPTADLDHPQHPVNAVPHRITVAPRDFEAEQPADQSTEK